MQETLFLQRKPKFWLIDKLNVLQEDIDQVDIIPSIKSDHSTIILIINSVDNQMRGAPSGNLRRVYWMTKIILRYIKIELTGLQT